MPMINLLVSVDRTKDPHRIAADLRSAGLQVTREMPIIGVIAGTAEERTVGILQRVGGVVSVEREREYQFAPSTSPIQ
jgi:hypothetical protein